MSLDSEVWQEQMRQRVFAIIDKVKRKYSKDERIRETLDLLRKEIEILKIY